MRLTIFNQQENTITPIPELFCIFCPCLHRLPYASLVGGALALRTEHFLQVNGYSNLYWGWGGEDDDMSNRLGIILY